MSRLSLWALLAALAAPAAWAQPATGPSLAVFPIEPRGAELSDAELGQLNDHLGSQAAATLGARLIPWQDAQRALRARDLYFCLDRRCQMEIERELSADYSLLAVINKLGSKCILQATLYASGSPASLRTAMQRVQCNAAALQGGVDGLVAALAGGGPLPEARTASGHPPAPVQRPPAVQRPTPVQRPSAPVAEVAPPAPPGESPAEVASQPAAAERPAGGLPRFSLVGGVLYAPAPIVRHEWRDSLESKKVPDRVGPMVSFDWRFARYLLVGGQAAILLAEGAGGLEAGVHFGGLFPLGDRLGLFGLGGLGVNLLDVDPPSQIQGTYRGVYGRLGIGLRHFFSQRLGLEAQLAGQAGYELSDEQRIAVFRLQLQLGLIFGFGS